MSILLAVVIIFTWWVAVRLHGAISIVVAGVLGFTAYSIPALVGFYIPPSVGDIGLPTPTSSAATVQMVVAWVAFCASLILLSKIVRSGRAVRLPFSATPKRHEAVALLILLGVSLALYAVISVVDSPFFFLDPRQTQDAAFAEGKLMWRWINAFGLLLAVSTRSRRLIVVFGLFVLMYCVAGDRTVIAILTVALGVHVYSGQRLKTVIGRPPFLMGGLFGFVLVLFGKPIYLALKQASIAPLVQNFSSDHLLINLNYFEPFGVHNYMEVVTETGFHYPLSEILSGVFAQFLIVPSAFGVDSSRFNALFTQEFYANITYGVAFNYWAEGYAVGGAIGVIVFAGIFAALLVVCQRLYAVSGRLGQITVLLIGVLMGIYIHRNSLENAMAFVRQILIVGLPLMLAARMLFPRRTLVPAIATPVGVRP